MQKVQNSAGLIGTRLTKPKSALSASAKITKARLPLGFLHHPILNLCRDFRVGFREVEHSRAHLNSPNLDWKRGLPLR